MGEEALQEEDMEVVEVRRLVEHKGEWPAVQDRQWVGQVRQLRREACSAARLRLKAAADSREAPSYSGAFFSDPGDTEEGSPEEEEGGELRGNRKEIRSDPPSNAPTMASEEPMGITTHSLRSILPPTNRSTRPSPHFR